MKTTNNKATKSTVKSTVKTKRTIGKGKNKKNSGIVTGTFRKISSFSPITKIAIVILLMAFSAFATWQIQRSNAVTFSLTKVQCEIRGRVWWAPTKGCTDVCQSGAGTYTSASTYNYCSKAVSKISQASCTSLHRIYIASSGCSRRWQQTNLYGAIQCLYAGETYYVTSTSDKCAKSGSTSTSTSTSTSGGAWTWPVPSSTQISQGYSNGRHGGIDIIASAGSAVKAVRGGTVTWSGTISSSCGKGMIVQTATPSGQKVWTVYQHMNPSYGIGSSVSQGATIGYIGNYRVNSCWTGPHLHFNIQTGVGTYIVTKTTSGAFMSPCSIFTQC